jgi:transcriptional regulator with XRE-family HTH domain
LQKHTVLVALGEKVRKKRTELGYSQEELAVVCGFDRTYISLVERGKRNLSLLSLLRLAEGLQTSADILTKDLSRGTNS